jgi:ribose 1,5-bisphosphokinase
MSGAQERKSPEAAGLDAVPRGNVAAGGYGLRGKNRGGTLILVAGPSGSGKDTLLSEARRHFSGDSSIIFCERIITRSGDIGEKHISVCEAEFEHLAATGGFFLFWDAHGLRYGIPAEMLKALQAGKTVIANVSRRIIPEARSKWTDTLIVNVTASRDVLRERLMARGRESAGAIETRLERAYASGFPDEGCFEEIDNSGALQPAADCMIRIIAAALARS